MEDASQITEKSEEDRLEMYAKYREQFPRAQAPQRLPLNIATGEKFLSLLEPYLKKALRKGVPPLFVDLRPLYKDPEKIKAIEELCSGYLQNLKESGTFDGKDKVSQV